MNLHWPQITWLVYAFLVVTTAPAIHGTQRLRRNGFVSIVWIVVTFGLLWCGGFFHPSG
jgi:hypothetical protein